jgi:hypothetical protein
MSSITRREFGKLCCTVPLAKAALGAPAVIAASCLPADATGATTSKEAWMTKMITRPKRKTRRKASESALRLGRFKEPIYFLLEPISWIPNSDQAGKLEPVEVPAGFVTDLASVPREFWSLLRPDDDYAYAGIVHDYLYWDQARPKATADDILRFSMEDFEVAKWKVLAIYNAVKWKGQGPWDQNASLKAAGEKRVLKQYPPNAKTRWVDWKKRADVFA